MKINLQDYEVNHAHIHRWYRQQGSKNPLDAVGRIATGYGVPCIVCAYWIGEITDWPAHIINTIESLIKFYGYTEILGKPENAPI